MSTIKTILAAVVVLSSVSLANASTYHAKQLHTREVSLPHAPSSVGQEEWMDRASQSFSGGGY